MTGRSMGPALMDAVRAAQRLPDAGLSKDAPVVFRGYSQGGGAAMWAGQLQPSYAPELKLAGVAGMEQDDCTLELLLNYQGKKVGDYFTRNPLGTAPWAARVTENRLGGAPIKVPVLQYHSDADEIVAFGQANTLRGQYCAQGVPLTWTVWNGLGHITLVYRAHQL